MSDSNVISLGIKPVQRTPMDAEAREDTLAYLEELAEMVGRDDVCSLAMTVQKADGEDVVFFRAGVHADPLRQIGAMFVQCLDIAPYILDQLPE